MSIIKCCFEPVELQDYFETFVLKCTDGCEYFVISFNQLKIFETMNKGCRPYTDTSLEQLIISLRSVRILNPVWNREGLSDWYFWQMLALRTHTFSVEYFIPCHSELALPHTIWPHWRISCYLALISLK